MIAGAIDLKNHLEMIASIGIARTASGIRASEPSVGYSTSSTFVDLERWNSMRGAIAR